MNVILLLMGLQLHGLHSQICVKTRFHKKDGSLELPNRTYMRLGDINIGVLFPISDINENVTSCSNRAKRGMIERKPELIAYAVEDFNKRFPLPNNMTLGFVILDDCGTLTGSVMQSLNFLRTSCTAFPTDSTSQVHQTGQRYEVAALICCDTSVQSKAVARISSAVRIPQISVASIQRANKYSFQYLLRAVSPDRSLHMALVNIIKKYHWNYVSVIYSHECEGKRGFLTLKQVLYTHNICIAASHEVNDKMTEDEVTRTAKRLRNRRGRSRVVIVLTVSEATLKVISAVHQTVLKGTLMWITIAEWESYAFSQTDIAKALLGSFIISFKQGYYQPFDSWFQKLTPNTTSDPWFADNWEDFFQCSMHEKTCGDDLSFVNASLPLDIDSGRRGYIMDAVFLIGSAVSSLLKTRCQYLTESRARECVAGRRLLRELQKTTFTGYSGEMKFDSLGNRNIHFSVKQLQLRLGSKDDCEAVTILEHNSRTEEMTEVSQVNWTYFRLGKGFTRLDSQCSVRCRLHEMRVKVQKICCWNCIRCYRYEIVVANGTKCEACSSFTWPDETTWRICLPIVPTMLTHETGIGQTVMIGIFLCICVFVFAFFHHNRDHRVIKASSIHLSYLMLFAIVCGYMTDLVLMSTPNKTVCKMGFSLLGLSFTLLYGPLLLRTLWIYRLFHSSRRTTRRPPLTSKSHQLMLCIGLLVIDAATQIGPLTDSKFKWWEKRDRKTQRAYVEITCNMPAGGLVIKLVYYGTLITACGCLAYKSRNLPHKFNESRFISVCVFTVLAISAGFIPIYFASDSNIQKMRVIVTLIFLNHSVALIFLFMTKIYMLLFVHDCKLTSTSRKSTRPRTVTIQESIDDNSRN